MKHERIQKLEVKGTQETSYASLHNHKMNDKTSARTSSTVGGPDRMPLWA